MKKKLLKKLLPAFLGALCLVSISAGAAEETCKSYLTGETVPVSVGRSRPVAIMFNNIYDAVPQYGISHYGVLVEAEVEGLITRFLGIMEDYQDCGRIGSVRSARNYYFYFAREFQATYMHFGEAAYALPLLYMNFNIELSGLDEHNHGEGGIVYYRSDDRVSPHNVFTDYGRIQAGLDYMGYDKGYPDWYNGHFLFGEEGTSNQPVGGTTANVVLPGYPTNHARFEYNPQDGLYYRYQYGDAHVDGDNSRQLTAKNIILQYCESNPFDENGYLWTDVVSGGKGKYISNGRCIDITWDKGGGNDGYIVDIQSPYLSVPVYYSDFNITHYYDMDGYEITLNPGQTWICLIRNSAAEKVIVTDDYSISSDAPDYIG